MKILVPVADPFFAAALLEFILAHRWPEKTHFHVVHIIEPFLLDQSSGATFASLLSRSEHEMILSAGKMVDEAASLLRKKIKNAEASSEVRRARVLPELLKLADEMQADLIIAGSHGQSGFNRLFLGSMSLALLSEASCPVLLVKPADRALKAWEKIPANSASQLLLSELVSKRSDEAAGKIMFCVDADTVSENLLSLIVKHNWTENTQFKVVSVVPQMHYAGFLPMPELDKMKAELLSNRALIVTCFSDKLKELCSNKVQVEMEVIEGTPKKVLLEEAIKWQADLLVVGNRKAGARGGRMLGSVSLHLLSAAPCSVLFLQDGQAIDEDDDRSKAKAELSNRS